MNPKGFPDDTKAGAFVDPPSNESLALSKIATSKTVPLDGDFLAFTGREFTNVNFLATNVARRESGRQDPGRSWRDRRPAHLPATV